MPDLPNYLDAHKVAAREVAALAGRARVTYPHDSVAYPKVERVRDDIQLPRTGSAVPLAYGTPDQEYTGCVLTTQTLVGQDDQYAHFYFVWETLPGPVLIAFSRIDPEDGSLITQTKQDVLTSATSPASSSGTTTTSYEARGDSAYVSVKIVTTTALDGVVRSLPTDVNLRLPRTLAGIAVDFVPTKADGKDDGLGTAVSLPGDNWTVRNNASASSSGSLAVQPEVFLPIRDNADQGTDFPATIKQVYLTGAITPAAILTKLQAVYEVVVSGTLSPAAGGTYLGNSSNSQGINSSDGGVIWFSLGNYVLQWQGGNWIIGTRAGVAAGNFWFKAGTISDWLGSYAPLGTNTGTATVAIGRVVNAWPRWGTQEVNLISVGRQASVRSNASASEDVSKTGGSVASISTSQAIGYSVSMGGSQSRIRVEPVLHGAITIAKSTYTDSVNATAAATLAPISPFTFTGVNSGFPSGTKPYGNAQFVTSYVRFSATPITGTPSAKTISGNTVANPTIVHTSTAHGLISGQAVTISGSNSTPTIDGTRIVTVTDTTHFSVAVNVTVAGTAGTVQGPSVSSATTIPATVPADVPTSGLYLMPGYETNGKDAQYVQVHGTIVDMLNFASAPTFISYSDPAPTYYQGLAIVANQPYFLGGAPASYAISPSIPAGLSFDTTTGIITGSPSSGQAATSYTVTATNGSGSTSTAISITVSI